MAGNRIRTVRPDLPEHPKFAAQSDGAKALWLGLLPLWDDDGRSLGSVAYIHGRVCFARQKGRPIVGRELAELEANGWLIRYQVAGVEYLAVRGWDDPDSPTYQFIKNRKESKLPAPPCVPGTQDGTKDWTQHGAERGTPDPEGEGEGDPEEEREREQEGEREQDAGRSRGNGSLPPYPLPIGWVPEDSEANRTARDQAIARGVDIEQQLQNLRNHALESGKENRDWNARWRRWLANAHAAPSGSGQRQEQIRKIPTLSPKRDPRVGRFEPLPASAYRKGVVKLDDPDQPARRGQGVARLGEAITRVEEVVERGEPTSPAGPEQAAAARRLLGFEPVDEEGTEP